MDNDTSVLDVQRSDTDVYDLPAAGQQRVKVTDVRKLVLRSEEQTLELLKRYVDLPFQKPAVQVFQHQLFAPNAWFTEIGDAGLAYFTDVAPHISAMFHAVFWDGKLTHDRREVVRCVIATAADSFDLPRVSAVALPHDNGWRYFLKKLGFVLEGTHRDAVRKPDNTLDDLILYGWLRRENCGCLKIDIK